jgi:hypothetical protein
MAQIIGSTGDDDTGNAGPGLKRRRMDARTASLQNAGTSTGDLSCATQCLLCHCY